MQCSIKFFIPRYFHVNSLHKHEIGTNLIFFERIEKTFKGWMPCMPWRSNFFPTGVVITLTKIIQVSMKFLSLFFTFHRRGASWINIYWHTRYCTVCAASRTSTSGKHTYIPSLYKCRKFVLSIRSAWRFHRIKDKEPWEKKLYEDK